MSFDPISAKHTLTGITERVLTKAKSLGASSAEVGGSIDQGFSVNVRLGDVETVEYQHDNSLGITVYYGQRKGSASTTDLSPNAIDDAVEAACQFAKYAADDPCSGLADPDLMATEFPDLSLYHPWSIDVNQAIELAIECEQAALDHDKRITNSDGVSVNTGECVQIYANTHGFVGADPSSYHSVSCMPVATDQNDKQRDYSYTSARDPNDLLSINIIGQEAAERTVSRLHAKPIATTKAPVILRADLAIGFLGNLLKAISGSSQYRKASFLLDALDKPVLAPQFTLTEDPFIPKAMASVAFDADGVATKKQTFVKEGILQSYTLGSYSARKLNRHTTGNAGGVHNLSINTSDCNLQDLFQQMNTGLFITELIGHGVNIVTGDYSQGAAGFWIENGEVKQPVAGITVAGNLKDMLLNMVNVGNDVDTRRRVRSGSILLEQMTIAGT